MFFGQMISVARERSRLSLRELAEMVGASAATLSRIEAAGHIPRNHLITRLIQVLKLNEKSVHARIARQRVERNNNEQPAGEAALSAVPIVGRIKTDR